MQSRNFPTEMQSGRMRGKVQNENKKRNFSHYISSIKYITMNMRHICYIFILTLCRQLCGFKWGLSRSPHTYIFVYIYHIRARTISIIFKQLSERNMCVMCILMIYICIYNNKLGLKVIMEIYFWHLPYK